jgi:hypothetical protein
MAQRIERIIFSLLKELQYGHSELHLLVCGFFFVAFDTFSDLYLCIGNRDVRCRESPVATPEPAMDAVLVAIAELKQVKDILNGLLADDIPAHLPPAHVSTSPPTASGNASPSGSAIGLAGRAVTSPPRASTGTDPAKK